MTVFLGNISFLVFFFFHDVWCCEVHCITKHFGWMRKMMLTEQKTKADCHEHKEYFVRTLNSGKLPFSTIQKLSISTKTGSKISLKKSRQKLNGTKTRVSENWGLTKSFTKLYIFSFTLAELFLCPYKKNI